MKFPLVIKLNGLKKSPGCDKGTSRAAAGCLILNYNLFTAASRVFSRFVCSAVYGTFFALPHPGIVLQDVIAVL